MSSNGPTREDFVRMRRSLRLSESELRLIYDLGCLSEATGAPAIPAPHNVPQARALARRGLLSEHEGIDRYCRKCYSYTVTADGVEAFNMAVSLRATGELQLAAA